MGLNVGPQQWWLDRYRLVQRSLRFNSSDSAYLGPVTRTGNKTTWTLSFWIKRCKTGRVDDLFGHISGGFGQTQHRLSIFDEKLYFVHRESASNTTELKTTAVFRDPSAWYHVAVVWDTNNGTASNRARIYVNGKRVTAFDIETYPSSGKIGYINDSTYPIGIGAHPTNASSYLDAYLADMWFVDGYAATETNGTLDEFGEFDANNIWQPKAYTGSASGTSFHLPFSDNSTSAALGTDTSGAGNDWSVNNIQASSVPYANYATGGTNPRAVFDNQTGVYNTLSGTQVFEFAYATGITYSSKVEIYAYTGNNTDGATSYQFNNSGSYVNFNSDGTIGWLTVATGSGTLTNLKYKNNANGTGTSVISAIRIDSTIILFDAGAGNDSLVDVPTNGLQADTGAGGEVNGNYATLNPLIKTGGQAPTLTNGNLDFAGVVANSYTNALSSIGVSSGKWYVEYTVGTVGSSNGLGFVNAASVSGVGGGYGIGEPSDGWIRYVSYVFVNSAALLSGLATIQTNDVVMLALDIDAGKAWWGRNGTWESSGSPSTGANAMATFTPSGKSFLVGVSGYSASVSVTGSINFGQRPFAYTAPSGFKALCTTNLPAPVVTNPSEYMDVKLYTGNGSTQTISGLDFSPDFVWVKSRSNSGYQHVLQDIVRGAGKNLFSSLTSAEIGNTGDLIGAFNSDGFSVNNNYNGGTAPETNGSGSTYVAWTWDAGSSTVTNTDGSITSSVRANPSAGFSIVTYTGNGTGGATVGHGLGVTPQFIIIKNRDSSASWLVLHTSAGLTGDTTHSLPEYYMLVLNSTNGRQNFTSDLIFPGNSTTFALGTAGSGWSNASGDDYVAYCFAPVDGYSSFGSYTGNGSADGPFVYTGFRPRWVLVKRAVGAIASWVLHDTARSPYNVSLNRLFPNSSNAEVADATMQVDCLSNGFKIRGTGGNVNGSGDTYIYAAFSEAPFQYARAR